MIQATRSRPSARATAKILLVDDDLAIAEALTELLSPLEHGWKARAQKEGALMAELAPLLRKRAGGREIAGLKAYEDAR